MGVVPVFAGVFKAHGLSGVNTGNGEKSKIAKEKNQQHNSHLPRRAMLRTGSLLLVKVNKVENKMYHIQKQINGFSISCCSFVCLLADFQ